MPQIYDMGPTALLPLRRKACWEFFRPKNPGLNPRTWVIKDSTLPLDHRSRNTHIVQQIHIRWQQYTQDNYNNIHKTTNNNTHKTWPNLMQTCRYIYILRSIRKKKWYNEQEFWLLAGYLTALNPPTKLFTVELNCRAIMCKLVARNSFRTRYIWFPFQIAKGLLSDPVNITRVIENGERYVGCNGIRAYCTGNMACCKLHSDRREKITEWWAPPSLLPLQVHVRYNNNKWKCISVIIWQNGFSEDLL